jgi:hypothetical protein
MNKLRIIGKAILEQYPNGFFSLDQIARLTEISRKYVTDVLVVFSQEGLIRKIIKQHKEHIPGHSPRFSLTYRVTDKKALANRIGPRLKEGMTQDRLWFIVRKKKLFTLGDLIILARAKRETARWFLKALRGMGIIRPLRPGGPGVVWALVRDIGPKRPYIETKRGAKGRRMKTKAAPKVGIVKRDKHVKVLLSKGEAESVKKEASKLNLSASVYLRMLIFKAVGVEERSSYMEACNPSS